MRKAAPLVLAMAAVLLGTTAAKGDAFPAVSGGMWTASASVRFDGRDDLGSRIVHGVEWVGTPDGGGGEATDTTAWEDGWHEIAAEDEAANILSLNAPDIAVEGGRLASNAEWTSNVTHLVRHTVVVPSGKTLSVGPGTVVKFLPGTVIRVEDGGTLSVAGEAGRDAIFTSAADDRFGVAVDCGDFLDSAVHPDNGVGGVVTQSSAATFQDNGFLQIHSFRVGAYPYVKLNDTVAFRDGGMAYVPVTIASGSRAQNFSLDWEAVDGTARFGEDYTLAGGTITWTNTSQGTKTLQIPIATDHVVGETTSFKLRIAVCRACNASGNGECTVTIRELDKIAFGGGAWTGSDTVRFDGRDSLGGRMVHGVEWLGTPDGEGGEAADTAAWEDGWRAITAGGEATDILSLNAAAIAVEGGRLRENTTWDDSATHLVRHWVVVPNGKTLTVGAGAVVKICPDAGIKVEDGGKLSFAGVDGADAIVTTADDDSAGVPIPAGPEDAGVAAGTAGRILFQSGNAAFADNGWFQVRGVEFSFANYGSVDIHAAEASRKSGTAYVAVTVGGNARNQGFAVDWEAVPGTATFGRDYKLAGGRLTWGKSSEGTKWIAIPLNTKTVAGARRKFKVRLAAVHGMAGNGKEATVEIREYEEGEALSGAGGKVAFFGESEASPPFALDESIWKEPMFRHDEEDIRLSGAWQGAVPAADTTVRLSWSGENGSGILAEVPGGTPATYTWRRSDWPVGSYTLKHEILSADGRRLAGLEKTFAVPDWAGVELHGGTVRSNETWAAGKVHVVYETVYVPALSTLMIEPGAIVKFLTGTGITIESGGGALFANGVVFTHINDDTVGGDTLNDGANAPPVMDAYTFRGSLTIGEESELRYKTQEPLSGTVSASRKLTRGSVYRVSGTVTVASGATLTIPAGTILKFDPGAQMTVNSGGTLRSLGTRASPVVFTSIKDDGHGGDTNGDGDATYPAPGDWKTVKIAGGNAVFENTSILYGSADQTTGAINMTGGTVVFTGGEIAHGRYDAVGVESGNFFMTNAVIRDCLLAFRHWARDPIVNCVVYDCGRLTQGGGQTFVNCAFSGIAETWEAFGFPKSTYRNCVFWNEGGSVLTGEGTQDALAVCGQDGNVWGDPKFRDPDNGDFRTGEGSACIDAADSAVAPALDRFGQTRWTRDGSAEGAGALADAGVAEWVPRGAASDIDLVAVSVACDAASAKPGETLAVHWSVANEGGGAVEGGWWDEIALVSESGRSTVLGEKAQGSRVAAGGVVTGTGYFVVPPLAEGTYRLRLRANSRHDVAEGSRTGNNTVQGAAALAIRVETADAASGAAGMLWEGATALRKFELGEGSGAQLCRVSAPAGTVVRFCAGFVPAAGVGGETTVDESGLAVFAVPEGTEAVYVVLEAGSAPGAFDVAFEDGSTSIASVSPQTVPRSGKTTFAIHGAGFAPGSTVTFRRGGMAVASAGVRVLDENRISLTVDGASFPETGAWDLVVGTDGASALLAKAVTVLGTAGKGRLEAHLDLPEATRRGRIGTGRIVYSNKGNADLPSPIFKLSSPERDVLFGPKGAKDGFEDEVYLVGLGNETPRGVLRAGETAWVEFAFRADRNFQVTLSVVDADSPWQRQSVFKTWAEVQEAVSEAATRLNAGPVEVCDYGTVYANAIRAGYGKNCGVVSGILRNVNTGLGMGGIALALCETNGLPVADCSTDANGGFLFCNLEPRETWTLATDACQLEMGVLLGAEADNQVYGAPFGTVSCRLVFADGVLLDGSALKVFVANGYSAEIEADETASGRYAAEGLADGDWTWRVETDGFVCATNAPVSTLEAGQCGDGMAEIGLVRSGHATVAVFGAEGAAIPGVTVRLVDAGGVRFETVADADGSAHFNVPPGTYGIAAGGGWAVEESASVEVVAGETAETAATLLEVPFGAFPCIGVAPMAALFFASPDARFQEGCTYAWDFDGDGTVDSTEVSPTNTYEVAGTYAAALTVVNPDGTEYSFRNPRAVEVWEPMANEYAEGTLVLDEASGYEIVSADGTGLVLQVTGRAVAAALYEGLVLVLPGDAAQARSILSISVQDGGTIRVATETVPLADACRTLRTAVLARVGRIASDGTTTMCPFEEIPVPFSGTVLGCIDLESELWLQTAIDKVDGKINNYYQGLQGTLTATFNVDAVVEKEENATFGTRLARKFGSRKMEAVLLNKTFPVAAVPVSVRIKGFIETKAAAGFGVSIPFKFRVSVGDSYRKVGNRGILVPEGSCPLVNSPFDEMSWNLNGLFEAWAGIDVTAGVGGSRDVSGKEWAVRVLEVTAKTGPAVTLEVRKQSNDTVPDTYRASTALKTEFSFAPLHASLGDWFTFTPYRQPWGPYYWNWFGGEVATPTPSMELARHDNADGSVSVSMRSTTASEDWKIGIPSWHIDDGTVYQERECPTHVFPATEAGDEVWHEITMYDGYTLDKEWWPAIPAVKAVRKKILVHAKRQDPVPVEEADKLNGIVPQSIDPNEVVGPAGVGDAETERFVEPGEWLDYTIYFENATNASAAAMQVRVTEELDPRLDWDTLELGEVVFANVTDLGLAGKSGGTSECAVPGADYTVRTAFSLRNGIATWHLRMVDPAGDEDGWPLDAYAGFLPPNDADHNGEGHVSYRIRVRADAEKNSRIVSAADIVFDWNETIPTDPSWWNRVGHLPVALSFDKGCSDTVVGMPRDGLYACDAPDFGSPVREGWLFEGWCDGDGIARNCGADLPYGTESLALRAQWREEVATRFATVAVEGGVAIAGFAEGQACPSVLAIPATVDVGGRRLPVVGIADDAFAGQRGIVSLAVAEGVRWIGARAFRNCAALESVFLPSTLERIGEGAFYGCKLLASLRLASSVPPEAGSDAFRGVAVAGTLAVPEGAEEAYAAWPGSVLGTAWATETFQPGGGGEEPGELAWMFWAEDNLLAYFDGAGEVRWAIDTAEDGAVGRLALVQASGSGGLPLPDAVEDENGRMWRITAIGVNDTGGVGAFESLAVADALIPASVERIAPYAFANCTSLTNVLFAGAAPALRELGDGAFFGCTALANINLEAAAELERAGSEDALLGLFESCWSLRAVTLPGGIAGIGAYAFSDCSRLRSVAFADGGGDRVESIGERAFCNCDLLETVDTAAMVSLVRVGAAAFGGDTATSAPKIGRVTLHRGVANLGDGAFLNASMLSEIACFAAVPPARGADAFRGVAPSGILRTREESAEDYAADNASGWIGAGGDKLPAWNGATGWQVEGATAEEELRERNGQLDDTAFVALLAEAEEWGFAADELCGVVHAAGRMAPRVRIVEWEGTTAPAFAVQVENGIDETPSAALARVEGLGGYRFAAWTLEDLDGDEREVPCTAEANDDGTVSVHVEPAAGDPADPEAPSPARGFWRVGMTTRE